MPAGADTARAFVMLGVEGFDDRHARTEEAERRERPLSCVAATVAVLRLASHGVHARVTWMSIVLLVVSRRMSIWSDPENTTSWLHVPSRFGELLFVE